MRPLMTFDIEEEKRSSMGEGKVLDNRWQEQEDKRGPQMQGKGQSKSQMRKLTNAVSCTPLNGSAWSTETKVNEKVQRCFPHLLRN